MSEELLVYSRVIMYSLAALFLGLFTVIQKENSRRLKNITLAVFFVVGAVGLMMRVSVGVQTQAFINDWFGTPLFAFYLYALVRDFYKHGRNGHDKNEQTHQ